jgi:hypothetical protein
VAKYWYRVQLSRNVEMQEVEQIATDLMRLFKSTDFPTAKGKDFDVTSPLDPLEARAALDRFSVAHGIAYLVAGTKED